MKLIGSYGSFICTCNYFITEKFIFTEIKPDFSFYLFDCFESHEHFFSYLVTVTITGDRAANLDLHVCLALAALPLGLFYMPHQLRRGTFVFKVISERPVILPSECRALGEGAVTTYFNVLGLKRAGIEFMTSWMLSESTTTRLRLLKYL
jgi:hypothetical protein